MRRRHSLPVLVGLVALFGAGTVAPAQAVPKDEALTYGFQGEGGEEGGRLEDADLRGGLLPPTKAQEDQGAAMRAVVRWNRFGTPQSVSKVSGHLSAPRAGVAADVAARDFLVANAALFGMSPAQLSAPALELLNDSPLYDTLDLARIRRGEQPANPDVAHAVLFRQVFGDVPTTQDGLISVGVTKDGEVTYVSSSATRETSFTNNSSVITASAAYVAAAASVQRPVSPTDLSLPGGKADRAGFTALARKGVAELQYARLAAIPTPTEGVRRAWEVNVVDTKATDDHPIYYTVFVDAQTSAVLFRNTRLQHLADASAALVPQNQPFTGTTPPVAPKCATNGPYTVPPEHRSIVVTAAASPGSADPDIVLNLVFNGVVVSSSDMADANSPEAIVFTPPAGGGMYTVQVCAFNANAPAISYSGTFSSSEAGVAAGADPRWEVFPANPLFPTNGVRTPDTRQTWCFLPGPNCDYVLGDKGPGGSRVATPAYDLERGLAPTFTTDGNNARTAPSYGRVDGPDAGAAASPYSVERNYTFPYTDQWNVNKCNPTNFFSPARNDIDAATVNLFIGHNRIHDWGYYLGFTERNYNLQDNNFGRGGRENDQELGQSQAGAVGGGPTFSGRDNANQGTPQDGMPGTTNQYLWQPLQAGFYAPCVDGAYDQSVISHEYGHAIQNRMVAGPDAGLSGQQARSMGESWSDLTAIEYLNAYQYVPVAGENPFSVGAFVTGEKQSGIRNYGMNVSPLNYSDIEYDGNGTTSPHADGEIWSATNFDIRSALAAKYESTRSSGNAQLLQECADGARNADDCPGSRRWAQIMHDAFLLQASAVSMLDARDAYLAADRMRFGGANQTELWSVFASRGLGVTAKSGRKAGEPDPATGATTAVSATDDRNPTPGWTAPAEIRTDAAQVQFVAQDVGGGVPAPDRQMKVYVGVYEARITPVAVANGGSPTAAVPFQPGTYQFIAQAPGFGAQRFTATFSPGQATTVQVPLRRNLASFFNGSIPSGDGGNLNNLIDDTEVFNWASIGPPAAGSARGRQVTVQLGGGRALVDAVAVSAAMRPAAVSEDPADTEDPGEPYDTGGQNRFSALRQFEVLTCDATSPGVTCTLPTEFRSVFVSSPDAFPADAPRPTSPDLTLRQFDVEDSQATHVRMLVRENQCTGGPVYQGDTDDDVVNNPDCNEGRTTATLPAGSLTALNQNNNVRVAEFQVFSSDDPFPVAGAPGGPGDPVVPEAPYTALLGLTALAVMAAGYSVARRRSAASV